MDYTAPAPKPAPVVAAPADPASELRALRLTVSLTLVSLVILAGSLGVYLFRQVSMLRRQNDTAQKAASQAVQHYKQNIEAQAMQFEKSLLEFARTHPDLQQRLAKFFPPAGSQSQSQPAQQPQGGAPAAPAAQPAPAAGR